MITKTNNINNINEITLINLKNGEVTLEQLNEIYNKMGFETTNYRMEKKLK